MIKEQKEKTWARVYTNCCMLKFSRLVVIITNFHFWDCKKEVSEFPVDNCMSADAHEGHLIAGPAIKCNGHFQVAERVNDRYTSY